MVQKGLSRKLTPGVVLRELPWLAYTDTAVGGLASRQLRPLVENKKPPRLIFPPLQGADRT